MDPWKAVYDAPIFRQPLINIPPMVIEKWLGVTYMMGGQKYEENLLTSVYEYEDGSKFYEFNGINTFVQGITILNIGEPFAEEIE